MRRGFLNANVPVKKKEKQDSRIKNKEDKQSRIPEDIIDALQNSSTQGPPNQWLSLPNDQIDSITKLLSLEDLIRFSCVCRSWKLLSASLLPPNLNPWLIVPLGDTSTKTDSVWEDTIGFFNLSNGKVYKVEIPQLVDRRICGSCQGGWLITVHARGDIQMLHPFSKTVLSLPPITKLPAVDGSFLDSEKNLVYTIPLSIGGVSCPKELSSNIIRDSYIYKAIMTSSDPATAIVMLIQGHPRKLTFCMPGKDETWRVIPGNDNARLADVTFYRGQFYTVRNSGHVFVVGGLGSRRPFINPVINPPHRLASDKYYLVEASGELLLVTRKKSIQDDFEFIDEDTDDVTHMTLNFRVYKLDFDGPKWTEVYDLGSNCALFIGLNQSFSLKTSDFPNCKANCIYFTDDYMEHIEEEPFGGHDIGVFSLTDGTVEKCYPNESIVIKPFPLWFSTHIC